ncbi:MAG: hypothetical protein RLZZ453_1116 [Chlamydiota bacterium]
MASLKKYNLSGQEVGQEAIEEGWMQSSANSQMVKDYIVALRENARQWSANTKTRAEVCHSGQKPHPQKGTGRARQGYLGAPQYKGGGRVHTPRPKFDQHVKMNRKEKQAVIRQLIVDRMGESRVHILQCGKIESPKTKKVADFLEALGLSGKKVLFVGSSQCAEESQDKATCRENLKRSMRNIPGQSYVRLSQLNGYEVIAHQEVVVLDSAFDQLKSLLAGRS